MDYNIPDLSILLRTDYISIHNLDSLSQERLFVAFMNAIDRMVWMDSSDIAERKSYYYEWVTKICWERMDLAYKQQILSAIPNIKQYMECGVGPEYCKPFIQFHTNAFHRINIKELYKHKILKSIYTDE